MSLPSLVCTRDHIGDIVKWIEAGHYVHLYVNHDKETCIRSCFHQCERRDEEDVESYLAQHWVISIDLSAIPVFFDLSLQEIQRLIKQGTCTCSLKERISTFENIPHLENLSLPCTEEEGMRIWSLIVKLFASFKGRNLKQ